METFIRLIVFLGIFGLMVIWEHFRPRRQAQQSRLKRWSINLGLVFLNTLLLRISVGAIAYETAILASEYQWGALHWLPTNSIISVLVTLLFLDFAIYCQHLLAHKWSLLWRLHQVHHTDLDFDVTTAIRFHPLEIFISMLFKVLCVFLIGADPLGVIAFEMILNGCAMFNHGNVLLPEKLDKTLRWLLITPDVHRIHHSTLAEETDSNYGFSLSCWDRLFGTYTDQGQHPQETMSMGLKGFPRASELSFIALLTLPFKALRSR